MIKKIRRKFIMITAMALFSVIIVLVISIIFFNKHNNEKELDSRLQMIYDNKGEMPIFHNKPMDMPHENDRGKGLNRRVEDEFEKDKIIKRNFSDITRFGTVIVGKDKQISSVNVDRISSLSEDEMKEYAQKIIANNKKNGWMEQYRYLYNEYEDGYMIIVLNGTEVKQANEAIAYIALIIAVISYTIVLLIIILFSNKAIKPISESYDKQRQFITDASHELKTPLTIIMANAEILELSQSADDESENEWIEGIKKQTEKLKELVNNLVSLSRMDEGTDNMIMENFNISDAVYDTAMVFKGVCEQKGKKIEMDIDGDIKYKGDESSIRQLVSILMDNAVKYCDKSGTISITLKQDKHCHLYVRNDYKDVANVKLDRLFDRFYRVDKARTRKGSYGLGLSIASMIVEKHHGKIKASNIENKIIQFEIVLK